MFCVILDSFGVPLKVTEREKVEVKGCPGTNNITYSRVCLYWRRLTMK